MLILSLYFWTFRDDCKKEWPSPGGTGNINELYGQEIVKDSWSSQHNINLKVL